MESILTDLRYGIAQLRRAANRSHNSVADMVTRDCVDRALDALERVEENLARQPESIDEAPSSWTTEEILAREG